MNELAEKFAEAYYKKFGIKIIPPKYTYDWFLKKCDEIGGDRKRYLNFIGFYNFVFLKIFIKKTFFFNN